MSASRRDIPLNDIEWPKDEDYVPAREEIDDDDDGPGADVEYLEDYDPHSWLDDDDDYGPDDDGGEGAAAF